MQWRDGFPCFRIDGNSGIEQNSTDLCVAVHCPEVECRHLIHGTDLGLNAWRAQQRLHNVLHCHDTSRGCNQAKYAQILVSKCSRMGVAGALGECARERERVELRNSESDSKRLWHKQHVPNALPRLQGARLYVGACPLHSRQRPRLGTCPTQPDLPFWLNCGERGYSHSALSTAWPGKRTAQYRDNWASSAVFTSGFALSIELAS